MKRSRTYIEEEEEKCVSFQDDVNDINPVFLQECEEEFYDDPKNIMSRNAVVALGSMLSTMDSNRVNDINHVFMNTIKKKHLKATNQGRS